ncbi:lycopene cyclase domain-containing protein [Haloplanus sp. C73]|uniref:lycopene cyclase domain-containing protein n=1 Tax=Haloplanus sp. C73 TaxID=3421641 RepID=UPI003EBE9399
MAIARHGSGVRASVGAVASQIHPVFMLPPLAASGFGAVLAGFGAPRLALLHVAVAFCALYTAHVKDGLVDFHHRGEDDDHPLTRRGCHLALAGSTALFFVGVAALALRVDAVAAILALPGWVVAVLHAPHLDTNPFGATLGYPVGIGFALLGGYYVQSRTLSTTALAFAAVFVVVLAGIKVVDDTTDYDYDRSVDKRTVAVVVGRHRARVVAGTLMTAGMVAVVALSVTGVLPRGSAFATLPFLTVAVVARRADAELATMLLVRASYLFFALLVVVAWLRPLAGVAVPDITVLGPYTYLATELLWGAAALGLVVRAGALRAAARTAAVLYPFAYVWDWYTLSVGVFAIPMRTGIDLLGIPLEEHLFMLVVPTMVVGVHETLRELDDSDSTEENA